MPNAFERRIFEAGERIEWGEGVFFLDVETGHTEAYRVAGAGEGQFISPDGAWVTVGVGWSIWRRDWDLLLHRESGQAWRWVEGEEKLLEQFLKEHLQVESPLCVVYPEPRPPLGQAGWGGVPCGDVGVSESAPREAACPTEPHQSEGRLSPDGRYLMRQMGEPLSIKYRSEWVAENPFPSVVIIDTVNCEPLFRVRHAYGHQIFWEAQWLSNSEGVVVGVRDGYVLVSVPEPEITYLPLVPSGSWSSQHSRGPVPAPTGDGRYFAYDFAGVYDLEEDRWIETGLDSWGPFSWGETHEEMRYELGYWGEGFSNWLLLTPSIEFPPFAEDGLFHVVGTGSCLNVREAPSREGAIVDCIADGTKVAVSESPQWKAGETYDRYPFVSTMWSRETGYRFWLHVRTEAGVEGWGSADYLESRP